MAEHDPLEDELRRAFRVRLPAAPASLDARLDRRSSGLAAPRRWSLLVVPAALAVAVALFAAGVGRGPEPSTSVGSSATPTTASSSATAPVPASTGVSSATAVPVPTWALHAIEVVAGPANVTDLWAFNGMFVGLVWAPDLRGDAAELVASQDGRQWTLLQSPRPGFVAATGTVRDGELHLLGHTGSFEKPTWWHYATTDGGTWRMVGQVTGIPASTYVLELGAAEIGWLARISVYQVDLHGAVDGSTSQVLFSTDGLDWVTPDVPVPDAEALYEALYAGVATDGRSLAVLRYVDTGGDADESEVITSTDGRTWIGNVIETLPGGPRWLANDGQHLVAVGSELVGSSFAQAAWRSSNGATWESIPLSRPLGRAPNGLQLVVPTERGFVALGGEYGDVWLSPDGGTWRPYAVLPDGQEWIPFSAAVLDDAIVVGGQGPDSEPVVWIGSLAELTTD